jgi:5-methylcytosine-specific restriction endonuclease McrA
MKICTKCKQEKAFECFYKDKSRKDGMKSECKDCVKEYQQSDHFKEIHRRANRRYNKTDNAKKSFAKYRKSEKGKVVRLKMNKRYFKTEKGLETIRRYKKTDKFKAKQQRDNRKSKVRRRTILKNLNEFHTEQEWQECIKRYNNRCACCYGREKLTRDHIIPLTKGGTDDITNIQPLCQPCNSSKNNVIIVTYLPRNYFKNYNLT